MGIRPTVALWHTARTGAIGQLLPFNYSGKRPFERPLYFGSGQMANSHTSANPDVGD